MEDFHMGSASVKLFPPIFKMSFPEIVDLALPVEGVFHNLVMRQHQEDLPDAGRQNRFPCETKNKSWWVGGDSNPGPMP